MVHPGTGRGMTDTTWEPNWCAACGNIAVTRSDITTLTWAGELAAIHLEQRGTYELVNGELWRRHHWHYSTPPSNQSYRAQMRAPHPTTWTTPTPTIQREDSNEPPF